ncbi:MAG: rRNA maturation RNase YbeY [Pseudomonadota bacterium]
MHQIEFQFAEGQDKLPSEKLMRGWVERALDGCEDLELTVRFVGEAEIAALNEQFRQKPEPTNVLSFPADVTLPDGGVLLGDVVICSTIVFSEARAQHKTIAAHTAHMLIHGVLHLLGHDHQVEQAAIEMETIEAELLRNAGFDDPYQVAIQTALRGEDSNPDQGSNDD